MEKTTDQVLNREAEEDPELAEALAEIESEGPQDGELLIHLQEEEDEALEIPAKENIEHWIRTAAQGLPGELTIRFVDAEEGLELNKSFRGKEKPTNVLTFVYCTNPIMADIAICLPVLVREAAEQNKSLEEHLTHLVVHGVLHARGYDHIEQDEAEEMEQLETDILNNLGYDLPYPDRNYVPRELR